jgi:hypothetical protein
MATAVAVAVAVAKLVSSVQVDGGRTADRVGN